MKIRFCQLHSSYWLGCTLHSWRLSLVKYLSLSSVPQALYENMLVELPFASFFLSKLLGTSAEVDIHHLASLDPEMYRNLLFLKSYEGDVEDLGLNFTVVNNDLGEAQVNSTSFFPPFMLFCLSFVSSLSCSLALLMIDLTVVSLG